MRKVIIYACAAVVIFLLLFLLVYSNIITNFIAIITSHTYDASDCDQSSSSDYENENHAIHNSSSITSTISTSYSNKSTINTTSFYSNATSASTFLPSDNEFVRICDFIPEIIIDLRYSTVNNFTSMQVYDFEEAYLRYGTVKKLILVNDELLELGYRLVVWDAFRPYKAQCDLWNICPNPAYVSNPETGNLSHCRGGAVDVTIISIDGSQIIMPTDFDNFSPLADRDYSDVSDSAKENAIVLEECMKRNGFTGYFGEWWHYSDSTAYPIDYNFLS